MITLSAFAQVQPLFRYLRVAAKSLGLDLADLIYLVSSLLIPGRYATASRLLGTKALPNTRGSLSLALCRCRLDTVRRLGAQKPTLAHFVAHSAMKWGVWIWTEKLAVGNLKG